MDSQTKHQAVYLICPLLSKIPQKRQKLTVPNSPFCAQRAQPKTFSLWLSEH